MRTVKNTIEHLLSFPMDATVHAYEGETHAIVVTAKPKAGEKYGDQIGNVYACEDLELDDEPASKAPLCIVPRQLLEQLEWAGDWHGEPCCPFCNARPSHNEVHGGPLDVGNGFSEPSTCWLAEVMK